MESLWKSIPNGSMLNLCTVFKFYDLNAIEKIKGGWKGVNFFPYC